MSQTTAKISVEGQRTGADAIPAGGVVRIDPDLNNAQGNIVSPDTVQVFGPFMVFLNDDPLVPATYGTFDVQNLTESPQDLFWCAEYLFSAQYGHTTRQLTLGPRGVPVSPRPPVVLPWSTLSFLDLIDTPASYLGQAGKVPAVNVTEDALEFVDVAASIIEANTRYVAVNGNDITGDGSIGNPYATAQKAYNDFFPGGSPTGWANYDQYRKIVSGPGCTAGDLQAANCKLILMGQGEFGIVTFDMNSHYPDIQLWGPAPPGVYWEPVLIIAGVGGPHNSSDSFIPVKVSEVHVANDYRPIPGGTANLGISLFAARINTFYSQRLYATNPDYAPAPIYVDVHDSLIATVKDAAGVDPDRAGSRSWSGRFMDSVIRAQVSAINGGIQLYEMDSMYFRRGFNGVLITSFTDNSFNRGWRNCYTNGGYGFIFTNPGATVQKVDHFTCKSILQASGTSMGNVKFDVEVMAGTTLQRPTAINNAGFSYYDTTIGKPVWWTGAGWVDATGAPA